MIISSLIICIQAGVISCSCVLATAVSAGIGCALQS